MDHLTGRSVAHLESDFTICEKSETGRHYQAVTVDEFGRSIANGRPIRNGVFLCERCGSPIRAVGPRWEKLVFVITEEEDMGDLLSPPVCR